MDDQPAAHTASTHGLEPTMVVEPTAAFNACAEMKVHLGGDGTAVLRYSESRHALSLDLILVPSTCRGMGLGTALIHRLFAIADVLGKPVHTTARPIGQSDSKTLARLVSYYQRLGFVVVEEGFCTVCMKRPARLLSNPS